MAQLLDALAHRPGESGDGPHLHRHRAHGDEPRHGLEAHEGVGKQHGCQVHHGDQGTDALAAHIVLLELGVSGLLVAHELVHDHTAYIVGPHILPHRVVHQAVECPEAAVAVDAVLVHPHVHLIGPVGQGDARRRHPQSRRQQRQRRPGGIQHPHPRRGVGSHVSPEEQAADGQQGVEDGGPVLQGPGQVQEEAGRPASAAAVAAALHGPDLLIHDLLGFQLLVVHGQALPHNGQLRQVLGFEQLVLLVQVQQLVRQPQAEVQPHHPPDQGHDPLPARQEAVQDPGAQDDAHKGKRRMQQGGQHGHRQQPRHFRRRHPQGCPEVPEKFPQLSFLHGFVPPSYPCTRSSAPRTASRRPRPGPAAPDGSPSP